MKTLIIGSQEQVWQLIIILLDFSKAQVKFTCLIHAKYVYKRKMCLSYDSSEISVYIHI